MTLPKPRRAVVLSLEIQADNRTALVHALEDLATQISLGEINGPTGASGSCSVGFSYSFSESDKPTRAEYVEQLDAYLAEQKKG